ncbi:conserved hypothetical protein TIGR00246 [Luminiphilus syltensis NOR5-1B]|uniref:Ribosomal RNA large subunit methyltransferase H n=2 Tax=Luminiphilus TaxID=1341118 RepID=B8KSM2_9GAMM|nr:conserved hypothetical protein TIGR00246 [Luminiphilus syltensis NOR5-1B]
MAIRVLAVGAKMPRWVDTGVDEYQKRLPRDFKVSWHSIPPAKRQGDAPQRLMAAEADAIRRQIKPREHLVVLDVGGTLVSTEAIAAQIARWQLNGESAAIVIGGPDGIDPELGQSATAQWSLGRITLPHPLVRVILAEQLYRAWSINAQHPYHRA